MRERAVFEHRSNSESSLRERSRSHGFCRATSARRIFRRRSVELDLIYAYIYVYMYMYIRLYNFIHRLVKTVHNVPRKRCLYNQTNYTMRPSISKPNRTFSKDACKVGRSADRNALSRDLALPLQIAASPTPFKAHQHVHIKKHHHDKKRTLNDNSPATKLLPLPILTICEVIVLESI